MASDYQAISKENTIRYGTDVDTYGQDFAERYTERTHFLYELLQNAEDALRWRRQAGISSSAPKSVSIRLYKDRLEVSHFGLPFQDEHVRAICSIKRGTKSTSLTDIGKFGIGFKSVFAYTKRPEVHSGDENFAISRFVHPEATAPRATKPGETFFYIPFDNPDIPPAQAHAEISARLVRLGFRTLLFLVEIENVDWEVHGGESGSYLRRTRLKKHWKEVILTGKTGNTSPATQRWLVFGRDVFTAAKEPAGQVEVAFLLRGTANRPVINRAEDSTLVVFFPTEKETHCGFLIQGPYKTTPSRDNIPHDNHWNTHLIGETAKLVGETLVNLGKQNMASIGLLEALPLFRNLNMPENWMFSPIYDVIVETLKEHPLIPAARGRFVSAQQARFAKGKGFTELFQPEQLTSLLGRQDGQKLRWVSPELSDGAAGTSAVGLFLRFVLFIPELDAERLLVHLDSTFFERQSDHWMLRFYKFLLDHERLWRRGGSQSQGILLNRPFVRVAPNKHVIPFNPDGTPNVYLPTDETTEYTSVHRPIANSKIGDEFFRKLGLTTPDITAEVLYKVVPQYESESIDLTTEQHGENLRKILRAMASDSPYQPELMQRLTEVYFLQVTKFGGRKTYYAKPGSTYLKTAALETYFEGQKDVYFLRNTEPELTQDKVLTLLEQLGVASRPRRQRIRTEKDPERMAILRDHRSVTRERFANYDLEGLANFIRRQKKAAPADEVRRARILWDFLIQEIDAPIGGGRHYFEGTYEWKYYSEHSKTFDAHFLEALRAKPWIPGKDGKLHRPSDFLSRDLPTGFPRHLALCEMLQLKADILVELARKAGLRVEDILFLKDHRQEFETLKQSIKQRGLAAPIPAVDSNGSHPGPRVPTNGHNRTNNPSSSSSGSGSKDNQRNGDELSSSKNSGDSSQDGSFATYIYVSPNESTAETDARNSERSKERTALGELGVKAVMERETAVGRIPHQMAQTHAGYDIESKNAAGEIERYIEVKTIRTQWGERGVTLSSAQFEAARLYKSAYWLYIVENPDSAEQKIYRLWNPGELSKWYVFDLGWRTLAEPDLVSS